LVRNVKLLVIPNVEKTSVDICTSS